MEIKNIEDMDFSSLSTEEVIELGLNKMFREPDGTYDWIYSLNMTRDFSMFYFVLKVVLISFALPVIMLFVLSFGTDDFLWAMRILALCTVGVSLVVIFSYWLITKLYNKNYMLIYQMNDEILVFSQTTDQAQVTRALAATTAVAGAAGNNIGGVISGTGMAMSPNAHITKFTKVKSVKGKRADNMIWVNSFFLYQSVYVPPEYYDFVWDHITKRCIRARIKEG